MAGCATSPHAVQRCPLCSEGLTQTDAPCVSARSLEQQLAVQLEQAHLSPCYEPASARPWRCPGCNDKRNTYSKGLGLARHLLKAHAAAGSGPGPPRSVAASAATTFSPPGPPPGDAQLPAATRQAAFDSGALLQPPCLPWLPRPTSVSRRPKAAVLLASWNLERFSLQAADCRLTARKVANVCATLRQLCAAEGGGCGVVVALQEVFSGEAVAFLADYLNEKEAAAAAAAAAAGAGSGGNGRGGVRTWHCVTSGPLGNNAERAAFLWSGPPSAPHPPPSRWLPRRLAPCGRPAATPPPPAPLFADPGCSFQLLREDDLRAMLRGRQEPGAEGRFIRSPFFGLFRVGWANLLVVNVHLAAEAAAARSEVAALNRLAAAIEAPNCRLLRRRMLGGLLRGRHRRGLVAIAGDFNCSPPGRPVAAAAGPHAGVGAGGGGGGGGPAQRRGAGAVAEAAQQPAATAASSSTAALAPSPRQAAPLYGGSAGAGLPGEDWGCTAAAGAGSALQRHQWAQQSLPGPLQQHLLQRHHAGLPAAPLAHARCADSPAPQPQWPVAWSGPPPPCSPGGGGQTAACARAGSGAEAEAAGLDLEAYAVEADAVAVSLHVSRALPAAGLPLQSAPTAAPAPAKVEAKAKARAGKAAAAGESGWDVFSRQGWFNALAAAAAGGSAAGSSGQAGGVKPQAAAPLVATNWRAKQPRALDAICLRADDVGEESPFTTAGTSCGGGEGGSRTVVTGRGVCPPPPYVDPQQPAAYPNHLLCWVRLDMSPLQGAPGKPRALLAPARLA
ncbi:hypothetical protein HXX76_013366 [Chlamydomonas incerta]|uniref:Endonuclease/exonuclease/phosphatase domain-containing protein n=1 Tax=Chlamydomonas incerta TaxID=51695 RepID=A0A835VSC5_CHLIN|nr:hypothetical protein HXX76_013366 [Chlamydomonas incerta]|eukprot:KAG2425995.1 hypothetical protein HXX76_013366 [Chlamydomonas incerta]